MKTTRKIINIDENLCDGCGLCIPSCHEQAIQLVETSNGPKARLVKEIYCDGLGDCLGTCPTGALTIEEREADAYDEEATQRHMAQQQHVEPETEAQAVESEPEFQGCPSARMFRWDAGEAASQPCSPSVAPAPTAAAQSELRQWPVQLHLVPPNAPYFQQAELVVAADCVPFAFADFHQKFLKGAGKAVVVGCPKLDDTGAYLEKLTQILQQNQVRRITIVKMEVPCCSGLARLIEQAVAAAGVQVPISATTIGIKGDILS